MMIVVVGWGVAMVGDAGPRDGVIRRGGEFYGGSWLVPLS